MRRLTFGLVIGTLAVAVTAAPVPKELAARTYYPAAVGSKWEYALDGETNVVLAVEVTKVTEKDGVRTVRVEQTAGPKTRDYPEEVVIDAKGVHLSVAADQPIVPPRLDQKPVPKAGDEWDGPHEWRGAKYTCTTTVGTAEKVTVPAGTFTALPHTQSYTNYDPPQVWTAWYAPGVGRVKFKNYEGNVHVLVKFTPGKEGK